MRDPPGTAWPDGEGGVEANPPGAIVEDVAALPWPAYDLVEMEAYFSQLHTHLSPQQAHARYAPVFTSRGCPYRCIYCHSIFGKKWRARSPESVVGEMKTLVERFGIKEFEIIDDAFNLDRRRVLEICDLIEKEGLEVSLAFPNGLRTDVLDDEVIHALRRAGVAR